MTADPIIDVAGLAKTLHGAAARRDACADAGRRWWPSPGIDLQIERGAMVGYIGPNGAGKSTTIKMLTGILVPSDGRVRVDGLEPSRERTELAAAHRRGVRPALAAVVGPAAARQLRPAPPRVPRARRTVTPPTWRRFASGLELGPLLDVPVRQLSLGQRMRGELTAALLHDPAILLLDEPTIGLDIV